MKIPALLKSKTSEKVGWGPGAAIIVTVLVFLLSQLFASIVISIYPLIKHWNKVQSSYWLSNSLIAQFIIVLSIEFSVVALLWLFLRHRNSKFINLGLKRPRLVDIAYALGGFAVYFLVFAIAIGVIQGFVSLDFNQEQQLGFSRSTAGAALIPIFISLVILPPIVEEILMRGFLYTGLRNGINKIPAALLTSVIFAAAHLQWGSGAPLLWVAAIDTFMLSLVLVYLREKTDSLAASIMLHMIKNCLVFVKLFILHNT